MSKDRDYIKELFDSDGIRAPESLSEENMLAMLERAEAAEAHAAETAAAPKAETTNEERQAAAETGERSWQPAKTAPATGQANKKGRASWRPYVKRWTAVAAAALIALFGISGLLDIVGKAPDTSEVNGELYTFRSEREISKVLESMDTGVSFVLLRGLGNRGSEDIEYEEDLDYGGDGMDVAEAPKAKSAPAMDGSAKNSDAAGSNSTTVTDGQSHSETYLQVEDVDEADIVKTDGKYIYYVNTDREVVILEAKNGKTKKVSTIGSSGVENYIHDIYLKDDKLITVGRFYKNDSDEGSSGIVVYDISDRSEPKVLYDFCQTGDILSSRMVGDYVYLVTNDFVYRGGRARPLCGASDSLSALKASDISCMPEPHSMSYIVLSAVDVSGGRQGKSMTKAILGSSAEIYCNDHSLYITSAEWDSSSNSYCTRIVRAALDGTNIRWNGTAKVRGYAINQFAMDESNGYFHIATTSERDGMDVNNLYVLDSKLNEAGKVTGFARNESIKAVRYFGDKAYVITYEAIDPLFIIDLSDQTDPKIEGEVMIDGFSTLLVPVGEGRLLGIGHATGDNGYGGEYDSGLKLVLFDISDPSEPKVLDSKEFEDMTSFAQDDHHALTVNLDEGWFAIPYEIYRYAMWDTGVVEDVETPEESIEAEDAEGAGDTEADVIEEPVEEPVYEDYHEAGILVFRTGDKFGKMDQHRLDATQLFRSVYIGEWIYALDGDGEVYSFKPAL